MDLKLKGLTAVVTGASSGIGAAIADAFAREGCNIAFCSRTPDKNKLMVDKLRAHGVSAVAEAIDVTSPQAKDWLVGLGKFDIFVPNVSAMSPDWESSVKTDVAATVALTEAAAPIVSASAHGAITYVSSVASKFALPGFEAYGATKAAINHYMKSLSQRLGPVGVRVNVVAPGDTLFEGGLWDRMRLAAPEVYEQTRTSNPFKRYSTPEEVAAPVVFISSPVASFINGSLLIVDGGRTTHIHG